MTEITIERTTLVEHVRVSLKVQAGKPQADIRSQYPSRTGGTQGAPPADAGRAVRRLPPAPLGANRQNQRD